MRRLSAAASSFLNSSKLSLDSTNSKDVSDEVSIDEALACLYPDQDELEKRCIQSMQGDIENMTSSSGSGSIENVIKSRNSFNGNNLLIAVKTPQMVVDGLKEEFFTADFDPIEEQLWDVSSWVNSIDSVDLTEQFMTKIEEADTDKDMILSRLADMIEANHGELMTCVRDAHSIDVNLTRASVQVAGARRKIAAATNVLLKGALKIARMNGVREHLLLAKDTVKSLKVIKDLYYAMQNSIVTGDLGLAAEYAGSVLNNLENDTYRQFTSLRTISLGVQRSLYTIRFKTDKALFRLCSRKFASPEYSNIMKSYLVLDQIANNLGVAIIDPNEGVNDENHELLYDSSLCLEGMANRIERFQLQDIDSCLHTAVLEFIYASQHKKHKAAEEIAIAGAYSTMNVGEMVDLAELSLLELYNRITVDMVAPCIVRSCELLADIIHTNYLITQWHRTPFDPRNDDHTFLHRNPATDEDEESIIFISENPNLETVISNAVSNAIGIDTLNLKDTSQNDLMLNKLNRQLIQGRSVLWDELLKALVEMLKSINISAAVTADDIYAITWSVNAMIKLGKDFCAADCLSLSDCMTEKLKEYFSNLHIESFHMVRQIISAESWQNVPIPLDEMGGVFGIIKKNFSVRNSDNISRIRNTIVGIQIKAVNTLVTFAQKDSSSANKDQSLLSMFGTYGNPLHFMTDGESNEVVERTASVDIANIDNPTTSFKEILSATSQEKKVTEGVPGVIIVTQSCMNGLARYAGRYLEIMHEIPLVAPEAFSGLCQLFDYYLCDIFHGFVNRDERQRFTTKGKKMSIPASTQSKDFEALQIFLDRAMNEMVQTGQMIRDESLKSNSIDANNGNSSQSTMALIPETVKLSSLLQAPAIDLGDEQSFFALTERVTAAESCWFAINILNEIHSMVVKVLPEVEQLNCNNYISQYQVVANQLRGLIYKSMCPEMIKQQQILQQLVENTSWDSRRKIDENEHHEWVDTLTTACNEVWTYLSEQKDEVFGMIREQVWLEICQAAFDTALDGFCKIRKCSAEGRAAITIDVATLHDKLNSIHRFNTPHGKIHVDNLIQASYMAEDDMMEWVAENWQSYSYKQLFGLLSQTLSSVLNSKRLKDAVAVIDTYYECENKEGSSRRLSNLLSKINREEAGSKISSVLSTIRAKSSLPFA